MADIDLQGRKPEDVPEVSENQNPEKKVSVTKTPVEPELKEASGLVQLVPTRGGNELTVAIQMLASINKNLAFLASTIYKHLNPDGKK
jgi:hypothetical protein